jgi:hypothetical protein
MAISLSTISAIAARKGNEYLQEQINFKAQVLQKGALEKEKCEGQVRVVNVQSGGLGSVSIMTGGSAYPTAESKEATQLLVRPVSFVGHVSIPLDAAELVSGKMDSIKLVKNQFELVGKNLGHQLGRAVFDGYLGGVEANATITAQAATISVSDITGFRQGQIVDLYNGAASSKVGSGRVGSITRDGDGTGSVALSGLVDGSGVALTGNVSLSTGVWLQGFLTPSAGFRFTSLADIAGSGDLYGTTVSDADWSGTSTSLGSALTLDAMRELADDIAARSGEEPSHAIMHRLLFQDYEGLHTSNRRYMEGEKMDAFGKNDVMPTFRGRPLIVDDNCPAKQVFLIHKDSVKLASWREFSPLTNGKDLAEVSQVNYAYLMKVAGMFNLAVDRRNAVGRLTAVSVG